MAGAFLQVVLENLSSLIQEEIGVIMGVDEEMKKLSSTLTTIQAVLEDAEDRQVESRPIRDWLRKLTLLAYEVDDILDECNTHFSQISHSAASKLRRYSLRKVLLRHKIGARMKLATERLDSVAAERANFHLREISADRPREVAAAARETASMLNGCDRIYGREEDRDGIVRLLVDGVREKQEMSVLPVIGVGGLGKTTLARLVFNDPRVVEHFEERIWVCVSDNFETKTMVRAMIESATGTGRASDLQQLEALERRLWELLTKKRYLIVLDDVWNDRQEKWYELRDILSCGAVGASIIVTTRLRKVADIMGTLPPHCLGGLSEEHSWMLLKQRAFAPKGENTQLELEIIGKEIVKKCAGVPLAAKALGGILRFKRREEEWIYVRESEMWKLSAEDSMILPALRLSYHHLPMELRQCFAYFAAFPKDCEVEREELIRLWIAHCYISSKGTLEAEDIGNEICNELLLRSLLQSRNGGKISMHNLVHDLAESVMENKVPEMQVESNGASASTIRQADLLDRYVLFPKTFQQDMDMSSVLELTSLRVLDASYAGVKELPPSIANLKHLRYLNLSFSEILFLPNSLCNLWNLQVLNLDNCSELVALPKNMRYLRNLRHLCLLHCHSLSRMPPKIGELTRLKTLSIFVIGHSSGKLEELECLNLNGRLEIKHLERVKDHSDARRANLVEKKNLRHLILSWERNTSSESGGEVDEKVLEALEPHGSIEKLSIRGFIGKVFPVWMTKPTMGKIVKIDMRNCVNCTRLPKLGDLPHLKRLSLRNVGVEYITEEEEDEDEGEVGAKVKFSALEELSLRYLPNLKGLSKEQQESREAFPNLKHLSIEHCTSLILPPLSSLQKLEDLQCSSSTLALFSEVDTLTRLGVTVEEKTACFSIEALAKLTNLRWLKINGAKDISAAAGGGVRALEKLEHLCIQNCETATCIPERWLLHITSLKRLAIESCPEVTNVPEGIQHLQSLGWIELCDLPRMSCLPQALQQLSSLRRLYLSRLPELELLPDQLHQLTYLDVVVCPKLVSLPAAIPNLKYLNVEKCPELERRCKRGSGDYWQKIAHIPCLRIGEQFHSHRNAMTFFKLVEQQISSRSWRERQRR